MRDNVIDLSAHSRPVGCDQHASAHDEFLLFEGLELLATFRAINDLQVRKSILQMIRTIAGSPSSHV